MEVIRLQYRFVPETVETEDELPDWKQKLASKLSAESRDKPGTATPKSAKLKKGERFQVEIVSVAAGRKRDLQGKVLDDAVPPNWEEVLDDDRIEFALGGKKMSRPFARPYGYDSGTRILTFRLTQKVTLPQAGMLVFENIPTRVSLDRQDAALAQFVEGTAVNRRLARLIMEPNANRVEPSIEVDLIQADLEPASRVADIVGEHSTLRHFRDSGATWDG